MKKLVGLAMIGIFLFWLSACSQEQGIAPSPPDKKLATEKLEKGKKDEDPERELKELTLETIQKEGKMKEITPGMVQISLERQQLIGVKFGTVEMRPLEKIIRTVGRVDYDERKVGIVSPKIGGWIEELYVNFTGKYVRQGEPLLTIYSPELVSAQEEYLIALRMAKALGDRDFLVESAKRRLKLWDISDEQIKALEQRGQLAKSLTLHSPFAGFVWERMAFKGMNVMPGMPLFKIADLSVVWVYADIYEYELPFIRLGQEASIQLSYLPQEYFTGKVLYIYPSLNPETRTAKVRFEFPNPDGKLRPEMYANVEIRVHLGKKPVVPDGAIIDTGLKQIAIVDQGNGYFEPREVKVGAKVDGYYEILNGLKVGERVVTSANFLIDSESKFKEAVGVPGHAH